MRNFNSIPNILMAFALIFAITCAVGCKKEGCTNPNATNYDEEAEKDDESCILYGCINPNAENYDEEATTNDGNCIVKGCTNPNSLNYNASANTDDGSCTIYGCTNTNAENYNAEANTDVGCILEREKFIGEYSTLGTCDSGVESSLFTIDESSDGDNKVLVSNLKDGSGSIIATINGSSIDINNELDTTSGSIFNGNGTFTNNTSGGLFSGPQINLNFSVVSGVEVDSCFIVGYKL